MNSGIIKAPRVHLQGIDPEETRLPQVSLPADFACLVHIYQSDHNIYLLDFFPNLFSNSFPMGVLNGWDFCFFYSYVNLNKIPYSDSNRHFYLKNYNDMNSKVTSVGQEN